MRERTGRVLVVEDGNDHAHAVVWVFSEILPTWGYAVTGVSGVVEALEQARRHPFDAMLTDLRMQESGGPLFLRAFRRLQPDTPMIVINPVGTADAATEAMNAGAFACITRPFSVEDVLGAIDQAMRQAQPVETAGPQGRRFLTPSGLVGHSRAMAGTDWAIAKAAMDRTPVLIRGERGVGKGLVARSIHRHSDRASGPFVEVRCAELPDDVLNLHLFGPDGETSPSPTGAWASASGGTLVLDEVAGLGRGVQHRLMDVLAESGPGRRGGDDGRSGDVRVVSTTCMDLLPLVGQDRFRPDLYRRLSGVTITLPPLRERKEDLPCLAEHFLREYGALVNKTIEGLSQEALERFRQYEWPGNVRELKEVLQRAVIVATTPTVRLEDLPAEMRELPLKPEADPLAVRLDSR